MRPRLLAALLAGLSGGVAGGEPACQSGSLLQAQQHRHRAEAIQEDEEELFREEVVEAQYQEEGQELLEGEQCDRVVVRWEELGKQDLHGGDDPKFPDSMDSIAADPTMYCGDTAAEAEKACTRYNNWATFGDIVNHTQQKFEVMAADGVDYHDVAQGSLGTCYMLAAMASLAHSHPKAIQRMFVNREKWAEGVYTTRWFVGGQMGNVEVDDKIPTNPEKWKPWFVKTSEAGEWWPVILEKAWAKIYGSFKAVSGGFWHGALQAMTMAPIENHSHKDADPAKIFAVLAEATARGWPMGAGTTEEAKSLGLAGGHAYSVLNASHDAVYGDVVLLFNPWNRDNYKGAVPNEHKHDGTFRMTVPEYLKAFKATAVAKVQDDYEVANRQVQAERTALKAFEVSVEGDKPFFVTLAWPGGRTVRPCKKPSPRYTLMVLKKGSMEPVAVPSATGGAATSVNVEVTAGAGDYVIVAGLDFPEQDTVHEGHLIVHSEKAASIAESEVSPAAVFGPADGEGKPCAVISIKPIGAFRLRADKLVGGVATYWSSDEKDVAYWHGKEQKWFVCPAEKFEAVSKGEKFGTHFQSNGQFTKEAMSCGCVDDAEGVRTPKKTIPCSQVSEATFVNKNVRCEGAKHSAKVQRYCPETCAAAFCQAAS